MASILHVVSYYPPDRVGGVGEVVANLHRALGAAGHRSCVATTGTSHDDPTVLRIARTPGRFPLASVRLAGLARDVDIIHVHHGEALGLLLALQVLRVETPVLLTLHVSVAAMAPSLRPYRVGDRRFGRWSLRDLVHAGVVLPARAFADHAALALADAVTFISRSAAVDTLGAADGAQANVIYNGIPDAPPVRSLLEPSDLLFVGTNSPRKRVELLPAVLAAVRARRPGTTLRIVGLDARDNPTLTAEADALGVREAIHFAGQQRADALGPYYAASKVLLVPSAYEGLPMVILEGQQHGLPCVATRVSGHPEVIVDGENGFLVPVDDVSQMAAAALRLLDAPELARRFGARGRDIVAERFSVARQMQSYLALYAQLRSTA